MYKQAIKSAGEKMDKTIAIIEKDLSTLRAGRANPLDSGQDYRGLLWDAHAPEPGGQHFLAGTAYAGDRALGAEDDRGD